MAYDYILTMVRKVALGNTHWLSSDAYSKSISRVSLRLASALSRL
jgi:hypothetical protein